MNVPHSQRDIVDLRSDTVTRPTPEMYDAILRAPLGDDVLSDDPTVLELQDLSAKMTGKEAALFMPSGTMGNQIAIASHTNRGDAILVEEDAHVLFYEVGGPAMIANVVTWTLPSNAGIMDPAIIERHVVRRSLHSPGTVLLCAENTHNRAGGTVVPVAQMAEYSEVCKRHGMKFHLDGARVFNAAVALNVPVGDITEHVDSVSFCLSKGLCSPVGSVLCGSSEFIERALLWRKRLGGGMRQSGILAACGIVSLTKMVDRLADDHRRARTLACELADVPGLHIDMYSVQTNMVVIKLDESEELWKSRLHNHGIWVLSPGPKTLRLVFHADIDDAKLERAVYAFKGSQGP